MDSRAATVHCLPDGIAVEVAAGEALLAATLRAGIPHAHACGGNALCSTCRVIVEDGLENCSPRTARERAIALRLGFGPVIRLACQSTLIGDGTIRRPVVDEVDR